MEGRTDDTNSGIAPNTTRPWDASTIDSTSARASTTRLDVLFRIDALKCGLQSRYWALGVLGVIARRIATHATRPSRSSNRIRGHGWKGSEGISVLEARTGRGEGTRTAGTT